MNEFVETLLELTWHQPKTSYDVVIIGGGGHGLATAYYLATRHGITNVAVIEADYIGSGNSGRNTFHGPRYFNTDLSLVKKFKIWETHAVTFRAEGYNLFNNANFGNPSVSLTAPATFGKVSAIVGSPRIFQLALRYDF